MQLRATESNSLQGGTRPLTPRPQPKQASQHSLLNLRCTVDKLVVPEVVDGVLDEFNEGDQEPPGVGTVDNEPFKEDPASDSRRQGHHGNTAHIGMVHGPHGNTDCTCLVICSCIASVFVSENSARRQQLK